MTTPPQDPYQGEDSRHQNPYVAGRGNPGAYWGNEQTKLSASDRYGNPIPRDAKLMATLSHLSSLVGTVISVGILPFFGPLIFWLIYKDRPEYRYVTVASKNAFNFNFTVWLINAASILIAVVTLGIAFFVPLVVMSLTGIVLVIFHIVGAVKASQGEIYPYPFSIKILR